MNDKKKRIFLLAGLILLVLMVPLYLVIKNESHLANTDYEYKFRIRPYDPSDPVRGKYIRLFFAVEQYITTNDNFSKGDDAHIIVEKDESGWAYFKSAQKEIPEVPNYFTAEVTDEYDNEIRVDIKFNRYYLNEELALLGETQYTKISMENDSTFYALVTIKNGESLLKDVYFQEKPYREYLRRIADEE